MKHSKEEARGVTDDKLVHHLVLCSLQGIWGKKIA